MGIAGITSGMGNYLGLFRTTSADANRQFGAQNLLAATTTESNSGDVLDISAEAEAALQAAEQSPLGLRPYFGWAADGKTPIRNLNEAHQQALTAVQGKLRGLLAKHGIDTSKEIRLQVATDGRVIVANDHPQKAEIEQFFADDPELRNDFVRLSSLTHLLGAAQEARAFQKAYAEDPYAAVARYSYLFNSSKVSVSLSILGDQFAPLYQRAGAPPQTIDTAS